MTHLPVVFVSFFVGYSSLNGVSVLQSYVLWPRDGRDCRAVLLLVPGYNGSGEAMLDARWKAFAEKHKVLLVAPTFFSPPDEIQARRGYYYPELGSGEEVERLLAKVTADTGVNTDQISIFGFSAGAHFAHRFALWKPERVTAFVAYSAAWWSEPTEALKSVPALILCGEADDPRYEPTLAFFQQGQQLGLPWVWRSYRGLGHTLTADVRNLAEAFLEAQWSPDTGEAIFGDVQTYEVVEDGQEDRIDPALRVRLPTRAFAEVWTRD